MENGQIAGMGFVKISLLLYYSRIFISRNFILAANILIGIAFVFNLAIILVRRGCFLNTRGTDLYLSLTSLTKRKCTINGIPQFPTISTFRLS